MKNLILLLSFIFCAMHSFAQCTAESAAQLPFNYTQNINATRYIGSGKENKANTDIMYKKLLEIHKLFEAAFTDTRGMIGRWKVQVNTVSNEGLVTGYIEVRMQPVTCESDGKFSTSTGSATLQFFVYVNGFDTYVVRDKNKASGFTARDDRDTINGRLLYLIAEKQQEEGFKGFPMYYVGWNKTPEQSCVVITKPDVPLFNPVSIGDFIGLFRKWTAAYHPEKPGSQYEVTPAKIDKFVQSQPGQFFARPCITIYDRRNAIVYIRSETFVDDASQGNPWVTFNPDYINKDASATSVQFATIEWISNLGDVQTQKAFKDFKNNFDFKKLQAMLGK